MDFTECVDALGFENLATGEKVPSVETTISNEFALKLLLVLEEDYKKQLEDENGSN